MQYRISASLFIASLSMLLVFCKSGSHRNTGNETINAKPVMPTSQTFMPPGDYADAWRRIDSLEKEGLFQSAQVEAEALLSRARSDKNEAQVIKSLLYKGKFMVQLEEEGFAKSVMLLEDELPTAAPAEAAVLHSLLGELYATYLQNQGWQIQNRTPIPDGEGGDILTWSAAQIESRSMEHYIASIQAVEILRKVPVDQYRAITTEGQNDTITAPLRPVLYDLLAHRALDDFANERNYLTEPTYAFVLDDDKAFAPHKVFIGAPFQTQDTTSRKWRALKTYQAVLSVHVQDADPSAIIDADLKRLAFVYNTYVGEDKAVLYRQALEYLLKQYYDHPGNPEIVYALAQHIRSQDEKKYPEKEKEALSLLEDAIRRHPNTYGAQHCAILVEDIKRPELNIRLEAVNLPGEAAPVLVSFKNIREVWLSVYRQDQIEQNPYEPDEPEAQVRWASTQKPVQQRRWTLADPLDYRLHSTELLLDALPTGRYVVIVSGTQDLVPERLVSLAATNYSALMPVSFGESGSAKLMVTDRFSGKPLSGVSVDFFKQEWDRTTNTHRFNLVKTDKTNQEGVCNPNLDNQNSFLTRYRLNNDTLWPGNFYNYGYREQPVRILDAHFFTDRAIYRPGQTVYFKAVLLRRDQDKLPHIEPNRKVKATFYDANHQPKGELELRSNEYGTVNGTFTAPGSGLAGQMFIQIEGFRGQAYFNVEEYKRPKFEVTFEPTKDAIRLGDKLAFNGKAKAYAGSSIDGAEVRYRVTRQAQFPYWRWYWGSYPPNLGQEMEIANGFVRTAADGSFQVPFEAIPDRGIPAEQKPAFTYTISADVTDINGETRSGASSVTVGYVALNASLELNESALLDSLKNVDIVANNWAGQPQNTAGTILFQKLAEPTVFYKRRLWDNPKLKTIDEAAFKKALPDYAWDGEDDFNNWKNEGDARKISFNTAEKRQQDLSGLAPKTGYYRVTLQTKDAYGTEVEWSKVVQVWDPKRPADRFRAPNAQVQTPVAQPGETAVLLLGGRMPELHWYVAPERDGRLDNPEWYTVNERRELKFPVGEKDRGGLPFFGYTVYRNRFYPFNATQVAVPWSNKQLQISYETFRDKLKPGEQEVWRLKISGPQKEKVAAEMVAALYDASLDQFLPHDWAAIAYPFHYPNIVPQAQVYTSEGTYVQQPYISEDLPFRKYRTLNWFDFPLYGGRPGRMYGMANQRSMAMDMAAAPMAYDNLSDKMKSEDAMLAKIESGNVSVANTAGGQKERDATAPAG
ncbi:MAG: MG2 domain-containing protein, partial [Saprospiraceae bacterium]